MIYGPSTLFGLGKGCVVPTVPIVATALGADLGQSGVIASMLVVGQLIGNVPASWIVSRAGERIGMLLASAVALLGCIGIAVGAHLIVLAVSVFAIGMSTATYNLARHAFMTTRVPASFRARALSLLGGTFRLGAFCGPFVAAGTIALTGDARGAAWAFAGALVIAASLIAFGPDPERVMQRASSAGETGEPGAVPESSPRTSVWRTVRDHRGALSTVGVAAACLSGARTARDVLLPLWGLSIGADAAHIALVVGVSGAIDFALFYVSGQVMDRFSRIWAAVPSLLAMAAAFIALSFTHDLESAFVWFVACAALVGLGNGLSSGILLTVGADLAPPGRPAPFLAAWRTLTDTGGAFAPVAISAIAAASLPAACAAAGVIALCGAAGFWRWLPRHPPAMRAFSETGP